MHDDKRTILVIDDELSIREAVRETLMLAGFNVLEAASPTEALVKVKSEIIHLVLSDIQLGQDIDGHQLLKSILSIKSHLPVVFITAYGTVKSAVQAMVDGAVDYLEKPFEPEVLINTIERHVLKDEEASKTIPIAEDPKSVSLYQKAAQVAKTDATVLITGESGTGKEVLARFIHQSSPRVNQPFIAINCAAIPENLLEATMFGYEQGAFTGANRSMPGKFEQAQTGTLLLDEVSEMPLELQAKLLRVLQEHEVERIGGKKTIALDVRMIATSNRNLVKAVQDGLFREDLYYRLCVFPLECLPLRGRTQDILPLANKMMLSLSQKLGVAVPTLSADSEKALVKNPWPGNVRELENTLQRAIILQNEGVIELVHLDMGVSDLHADVGIEKDSLDENLAKSEAELIEDAIQKSGGSKKKAAELLGISPRTLRYKMAKLRDKAETV